MLENCVAGVRRSRVWKLQWSLMLEDMRANCLSQQTAWCFDRNSI